MNYFPAILAVFMHRLAILAATLATASAAPVYHDVVVYGGTSGGVAAGMRVELVDDSPG